MNDAMRERVNRRFCLFVIAYSMVILVVILILGSINMFILDDSPFLIMSIDMCFYSIFGMWLSLFLILGSQKLGRWF